MNGVVPKDNDRISARRMKCSRYSSPTRASEINAKTITFRMINGEFFLISEILFFILWTVFPLSLNPHQSVRKQSKTPKRIVSCRSSCMESAATNLTTGSPVGMAHETG